MEKLARLQGSVDMAHMKHNAINTDETKAALEAAQAMYDDAVAAEAAGSDETGGVIDEEDDHKKEQADESELRPVQRSGGPANNNGEGAVEESEKKSE